MGRPRWSANGSPRPAQPAAWLALDEGDSDLTGFLAYLIAALQTLALKKGEGLVAKQGLHGKLTLISAPAGFGKTTLVSEWLAAPSERAPAAWLALDEGDSDPTRFLTYLVAALQTIVAEATWRRGVGLLESPQPPATECC